MRRFLLALFLLCVSSIEVFAQDAAPKDSAVNSLQARIMAVRAQREDAMDQVAATRADLSLAQEEIRQLREQISKLTPKPDKPAE